MGRKHRKALWALAGAVALLLSGSASSAEVCGECGEQCAEAVRVCLTAGERAHQICHARCAEGDEGCRQACFAALHRARLRCADERLDCRLACRSDLDPICTEACIDGRGACGEDLARCLGDCRLDLREELVRCRELAQGGAPESEVRQCVERAYQETRDCARGCRESFPCHAELRECLAECAIEPGQP
jgi:hypothetical protein